MSQAESLVRAGKERHFMRGVGLLYCRGADATAESFIAYYGRDLRTDTIALLPELDLPVLIVAGTKDSLVKSLIARTKPPADNRKVVLAVVEDADHFFLDLFAEDVAD